MLVPAVSQKTHIWQASDRFRTASDRSISRQAPSIGCFDAVIMVVCTAFGIKRSQVFAQSRSIAPIARARQTAFYLAHIIGQKTYIEIGEHFGRDRTTVAHGCSVIEDLRDDGIFDCLLTHLETAVLEWCGWTAGFDRDER